MQKKRSFLPLFLIFLSLSIIIFLSFHFRILNLGFIASPLFGIEGRLFHLTQISQSPQKNLELSANLFKIQQLERENSALRDQFQTTTIPTSILLPAKVIGDPQFIPGISKPEILIIDKGENDGVLVGDIIVYKDNLVGLISEVSQNASRVEVITNKNISFVAKTSTTNAQGVLKGIGNGEMNLGNVLLSDNLNIGDVVLTNGSQNLKGGIMPGLIVGKIISVNKNPSSLYQNAKVESLLNISKLSIVFVLKGKR